MRRALVLLFVFTIAMATSPFTARGAPVTSSDPSSAFGTEQRGQSVPASGSRAGALLVVDPPGSYGCKTDTIAATQIKGVTYTATEKTCVEIHPNGRIRAHGVTKCYRAGSPYRCHTINGSSVHTHLWFKGELLALTEPGDADCNDCYENSHYSVMKYCLGQVSGGFQAKEENLRVAWAPGIISGLHTHQSDPVLLYLCD
jgi:hypothetical protein